jgi:cytoskeletal protein CcmA (bactofilin family)
MFTKTTPYTELLGKTNRIVEGTTIKGDITLQTDFRLDGAFYLETLKQLVN